MTPGAQPPALPGEGVRAVVFVVGLVFFGGVALGGEITDGGQGSSV